MKRLILLLLILIALPIWILDLKIPLGVMHLGWPVLAPMLLISLSGLLLSWFFCLLIMRFEPHHARFTHDHDVDGVQKFHDTPVPRVGGLAIFMGLLFAYFGLTIFLDHISAGRVFLGLILLCALPVFVGGLWEDLSKQVSIRNRLLLSFVSSALGVFVLGALVHRLDVPLLDGLMGYWTLAFLFTVFAVAGVSHSLNLIDGYNGLASGFVLIVMAGLSVVSLWLGDFTMLMLCLFVGMSVLGFMLWNWPMGKIFLGDGGAYFLGFVAATLSVMLLNRNPSVSPWFPLTLLGYPIFETLFSIYRRKVLHNVRPDLPDDMHMHQLIHRLVVHLRRDLKDSWINHNSMTAVPIWLVLMSATAITVHFYNNTHALMGIFLLGVLAYKLVYRVLLKLHQEGYLHA